MKADSVAFLDILNQPCQYSIPLWQRRYSWGNREIEQLISDLELASKKAEVDPEYRHYCGAMITYSDSNGPGAIVKHHRVIDGQQRMTTVSLLLLCISQCMNEETRVEDWDPTSIKDNLLTNPGKPLNLFRKLQLRETDEKEYAVLINNPEHDVKTQGRIAYAYRQLKKHVQEKGVFHLMNGLRHLWIVSVALQSHDDPQQVFQSLNTTGKPLTEGEKIKNWLLAGLSTFDQEKIYESSWRPLEIALGAFENALVAVTDQKEATRNLDLFFREFLIWKTGKTIRRNDVYFEFREWAIRSRFDEDRPELGKHLLYCANIYGFIIGTYNWSSTVSSKIESVVRRLRAQPIDVHRPLTLRILHDWLDKTLQLSDVEVAASLQLIETWFVRLWLSGRQSAGLNKGLAKLSGKTARGMKENYVDYWGNQFANQAIGVPTDEELAQGVRTRRAYGGENTKMSRAIHCAIFETQVGVFPDKLKPWTIEHIMPQTIGEHWKKELGPNYQSVHNEYKHRLANLTLMGEGLAPVASNAPFIEKKKVYEKAGYFLTSQLCDFPKWNRESLDKRCEDLTKLFLKQWPWKYLTKTQTEIEAVIKWKVNERDWVYSESLNNAVVILSEQLMSENVDNFNILTDPNGKFHYVHRKHITAKNLPFFRELPGHSEWLIHAKPAEMVVDCMRYFAKKCNVQIEIECFYQQFWSAFFKKIDGNHWFPENHFSSLLWSDKFTESNYQVGVSILSTQLKLWVDAKSKKLDQTIVEQLEEISNEISEQVPFEEVQGQDPKECALNGYSLTPNHPLHIADKNTWDEAIDWLKQRYDMVVQKAIEVSRDKQPDSS